MLPELNVVSTFDLNSRDVGSVQRGRKVIQQLPKNPADKCTIVSVFPREVVEIKPTLFPGKFVIPPAEKDSFSLLVVEGTSYYKASTINKMPPTEIQVNSAQLAESIVSDNIGSMWLAQKGVRGPGIFWIPGAYDKKTIFGFSTPNKIGFDKLLESAREIQRRWFVMVIDAADTFWAKSNGDPRSIPEDARIAAELLGMDKTKPWMANQVASILENCNSCGEMINKIYPVCRYCHAIIDPAKAKEMNLTFAQTK